jgi:hypothetical protein
MSAHALKESPSRDQIVTEQTKSFAQLMQDEFSGPTGIERLELFAKDAERIAHKHSKDATAAVKDDEDRLTRHADYMRTVSAHIVLLRDGLVPALKIYPESPTFRTQAIWTLSFIKAHFFAMETGNY